MLSKSISFTQNSSDCFVHSDNGSQMNKSVENEQQMLNTFKVCITEREYSCAFRANEQAAKRVANEFGGF